MRVLITGGTGLIGRRVVGRLRERGDDVVVLIRHTDTAKRLPEGTNVVAGDPSTPGDWLHELSRCDAVLHLAGEPIASRWTKERKHKVLHSRVDSAKLIAETMAKSPTRSDGSPRAFVCGSAVGYYGMYEDNPTEFTEDDLPGAGFLADVCVAWESATEPAKAAGVRVTTMRTGMVLAAEGGALPPIAKVFRWFVGGPVATGRQWVSWIHIDDLVGLISLALDRSDASGPINGTAPEPLTNWGFSKTLAKVLRRPCWLRAPKLALRLLMGEASTLATHGQRAIPTRAKALGYEFQFPLLEPALRAILRPERSGTAS